MVVRSASTPRQSSHGHRDVPGYRGRTQRVQWIRLPMRVTDVEEDWREFAQFYAAARDDCPRADMPAGFRPAARPRRRLLGHLVYRSSTALQRLRRTNDSHRDASTWHAEVADSAWPTAAGSRPQQSGAGCPVRRSPSGAIGSGGPRFARSSTGATRKTIPVALPPVTGTATTPVIVSLADPLTPQVSGTLQDGELRAEARLLRLRAALPRPLLPDTANPPAPKHDNSEDDLQLRPPLLDWCRQGAAASFSAECKWRDT